MACRLKIPSALHFKSHKCSVISLRENFDTSTAAGEMMLYNMANLAQYERRLTSERVTLSRFDRVSGVYSTEESFL